MCGGWKEREGGEEGGWRGGCEGGCGGGGGGAIALPDARGSSRLLWRTCGELSKAARQCQMPAPPSKFASLVLIFQLRLAWTGAREMQASCVRPVICQ